MRSTCLIVLTIISHSLLGQEKRWGLGFNTNIIQRANLLTINDNTTFDNVQSSNRWGFDLGFSIYYTPSNRFELRTNPAVEFAEDEIVYTKLGTTEKLLFGPSMLKLPTHVTMKVSNKIPIGLLIGGTPSIQISKYDDEPTDKLELKEYDFSLDIGINYPIKFPWFILYPEIRYSKSLINSAGDNRTEYGQAIDSYYRNRFVFGLYFR